MQNAPRLPAGAAAQWAAVTAAGVLAEEAVAHFRTGRAVQQEPAAALCVCR